MCLEQSAWCSTTKRLSHARKTETHSESEFKFSCTRSQDTEGRNPHLKNKYKIQNQKHKHASVLCLGTLAAPHLFTIQNWEQKLDLLLAGTSWQIANREKEACDERRISWRPGPAPDTAAGRFVNGLDARPRCKTSACRCSAGAPGLGLCLGWSDHWSAAVLCSSCADYTWGSASEPFYFW